MKIQNGSLAWHPQTCAEANNNSPSSLLFQMNCRAGSPPPTLFKYVITNRKKIFLFLCAFMMGTWIGSSFPYNQFGRHSPMGEHNCADVIPSLSAMGIGSNNAIREPPKLYSSMKSTNSSGMLINETRLNETHRIASQNKKGKHWGLRSEPTLGNETKMVTKPGVINEASWSNTSIVANTNKVNRASNRTAGREYIVDTPSCKIPNFDPWDPSLRHAIRKLERLNCGIRRRLTYVQNGVLIINSSILESDYGIESLTNVSCCYRAVQRPERKDVNDEIVEISNACVRFSNATPATSEFLKVECSLPDRNRTRLTEFHYTVPLKPSVEARCLNATRSASAGRRTFSVMILGMDALSRLNFERHLVKTRRVLLDALGAVEMLGYNKVGDNTFPNIVPLLSGLSSARLKKRCWGSKKTPFDACPWVWRHFAASGYRTLYGEDSTQITSFNYLKAGFKAPPTDYYLRPFLRAAEAAISHRSSLNTKLCLGPQPHHEVSLRWAGQFMETFQNSPYFGLLWSNSLTHDDDVLVQHADDFLAAMLADLHSGGRLNSTILIFVSDHGIRWGALRETLIGRYEERLPVLYVSLPEAFRRLFPEQGRALAANAHRLTSPFDLHATLRDVLLLAGGAAGPDDGAEVGQSLFRPVPLNRTCKEAGIDAHWCACQESVALDVRQAESLALARVLLQHLNNQTRGVRERCAVFSLSKVVSVLRKTNVQMHEDAEDGFIYAVTVGVTPGGGIFEATIRTWAQEQRRQVEGDVSRLNLYGKQSECVEDIGLRKVCFCQKSKTDVPRSL